MITAPRLSKHARLLLLLGLSLGPSASLAQTPGEAAPQGEPSKTDAKTEARVHFDKAVTLADDEAWAPALAEFRRSIELYPTRAATKNAAVCLQKLERYDEALEMFQALVRDYPNLTAEDKALAERSIKKLQALVGALEIEGGEPGASIAVDGRARGEAPAKSPLRVSAGSHVVRVYKEGFLPFETRVDVAGGQSTRVEVKLAALTQSGRLKVSEAKGLKIDVVVDNVVVGKTPWEGSLSPGAHTVILRGTETFGTQPASAPVKVNQVTTLNLVAEDLEAWMRVEPTPAGAGVAIDGVDVGRGVWEGRVRKGEHRVEVSDEGFIASARKVALAVGGREIVIVELNRDLSSSRWARPPHPFIELSAGFAFTPALGGQIADRCTDTCAHRITAGGDALLHIGSARTSGLMFGVSLGFLSIGAVRRETAVRLLNPVGSIPPQTGDTTDRLRVNAGLVGLHAGFLYGERFPLTARLAAGVAFGSLSDERQGAFTDSRGIPGDTTASEQPSLVYAYVGPELRLGYRMNENIAVSLGVMGLALFGLAKPTWSDRHLVSAGNDGVGTFPAETLMGDVVFVITPSLGVRYDF